MDKRPVVLEETERKLYIVCEVEPGRITVEERPYVGSIIGRTMFSERPLNVLHNCPKNWEIGYETKLRDVV